jgi:hypothetical protein
LRRLRADGGQAADPQKSIYLAVYEGFLDGAKIAVLRKE